jgi:DNA polymerase-3 subunit alpha (Gram-positive type)
MCEKLTKEGIRSVPEMNNAMSERADPLRLRPNHMILLAANPVGLKNLYKLISKSYLDYFRRVPRIPRSLITEYRDGLIIGSACESGELFRAILEGKPQAELEQIASFYDYLEIQPICNNRFLLSNGSVSDEEELRNLNRKVVALGDKLNLPVCATCDSHFLNKEDEIYRKILLKGQKFADGDRDVGLYLRTTDEMLSEFAYLGKEKAYEVVVTNTRSIAARCEKILPIPDGSFTPKMDGAEEDLQKLCWDRAMDWYGYQGEVPPIVTARLEKELTSIIKNGFAVLYMIAQKLVWYSESQGYLVGSRGSVGSSFVATMAGISEVNPLPPHYRCPKCRYNEFFTGGEYGSGFDMPEKNCPECGTRMIPDGQDIPFETFLGFYGDKSPDIDLNFSGDVQGRVHKYTEELFGHENVFRAGTLGTLASKTAYGYVMKYLDEKGISANRAEINRLVNGCVGVKRTTGQHPGGIVVIPREYDVTDFTPVQHPADDPNSDIVTTHFAFSYLHDTILKLDELGHDMPTKYKWLEKYTGLSVMDVPMNDPNVYELFLSLKPLGIEEGDIDCKVGTWALPEFGTRFVQKMLEEAKPKNFADLLQISGLSHGTDVWTGNAQDLIQQGICTISEVVGTRDSIMLTLIRYGVENSHAFKIMESVRKGKGLTPEWEEEMRAANVPDWYIGSCKKIKYMFPKAHAAAYNMSAIRLGWFKIYYPVEFYAAFFTVAPSGFDGMLVVKGRKVVKDELKSINEKIRNGEGTARDDDSITYLQIVDESMARGVSYLPVDLYRSGAKEFIPEDKAGKKIRVPFNSLPGLGDTVAEKIVAERENGEFLSREELQLRAGLSKSIMELLDSAGALSQLSDTNQISMLGVHHEEKGKKQEEKVEIPVGTKTFGQNSESDLLPDADQISLF